MSSSPTPSPAAEPQRGGSYVRHPETGDLQLVQATEAGPASSLRHDPSASDTPGAAAPAASTQPPDLEA